MSTLSAFIEPLWPSQCRTLERLSRTGLGAMSVVRAVMKRTQRQTVGGGPSDPPEDACHDSIWDDPCLWMLMLH